MDTAAHTTDDVIIGSEPPLEDGSTPSPTSLKDLESLNPAVCVICLDRVAGEAIALPCKHDQFHFACLGTWLQQNRVCPLCKGEVKGIQYRETPAEPQSIFYLAEQSHPRSQTGQNARRSLRSVGGTRDSTSSTAQSDESINIRRRVYNRKMCCLYVGSNRISGYRNVTPSVIARDERLVAKAKKWIRRELAVFDFLQPCSSAFGRLDRRASNAEFLLEYVVAILKSIELKGSAGQAQELLKDYLGRENACLFLHELEAWMRSPYEQLKDWDNVVQYIESPLR